MIPVMMPNVNTHKSLFSRISGILIATVNPSMNPGSNSWKYSTYSSVSEAWLRSLKAYNLRECVCV